jgi:hypothetical protein
LLGWFNTVSTVAVTSEALFHPVWRKSIYRILIFFFHSYSVSNIRPEQERRRKGEKTFNTLKATVYTYFKVVCYSNTTVSAKWSTIYFLINFMIFDKVIVNNFHLQILWSFLQHTVDTAEWDHG